MYVTLPETDVRHIVDETTDNETLCGEPITDEFERSTSFGTHATCETCFRNAARARVSADAVATGDAAE